jgi:cytidylate kinase
VPHARVVTISASYGAGGTIVAPRLADRLGVPYLERLISPSVARGAAGVQESITDEERPEGLLQRLVGALASMPAVMGTTMPQPQDAMTDEERLREDVESSIRNLADTTGGVVLGRGATALLAQRPGTFHVRLDGPPERRIRQAARLEGIDDAEAKRRRGEIDRARALYLKRFYGCDATDPRLYHLVLDSTRVPLDCCIDVIATAAGGFWLRG